VPVTLELLGHSGKNYLGIKVAIFNPATLKESGFFLVVDHRIWELTVEEKSFLKRKMKTKVDTLRQHFHLPGKLAESGF
jgi:hypothetical protein